MTITIYPALPLLEENLIGNSHNYYPTKTRFSVFGMSTGITNTPVDLWEGPTPNYVFPPAGGIQMSVVSTNANDTLAGTGAQKVHIHYLDNLYVEHEEILSMNGVTPVNTVATNIFRINGFHSIQVGTGGTTAGNISLTSIGGATTYGILIAGFNTSKLGIYTVPAGKTGYISHWQAAAGSATGSHFTQIHMQATTHLGALWSGVFIIQDMMSCLNGGNVASFDIPIPIPATADIKLKATGDAASSGTATGTILGWIE